MTEHNRPLPSGGHFDLDPGIPAAILAHLEAMCAPDSSLQELEAITRRDALLERLSGRQRKMMGVFCRGLGRLADNPRFAKG